MFNSPVKSPVKDQVCRASDSTNLRKALLGLGCLALAGQILLIGVPREPPVEVFKSNIHTVGVLAGDLAEITPTRAITIVGAVSFASRNNRANQPPLIRNRVGILSIVYEQSAEKAVLSIVAPPLPNGAPGARKSYTLSATSINNSRPTTIATGDLNPPLFTGSSEVSGEDILIGFERTQSVIGVIENADHTAGLGTDTTLPISKFIRFNCRTTQRDGKCAYQPDGRPLNGGPPNQFNADPTSSVIALSVVDLDGDSHLDVVIVAGSTNDRNREFTSSIDNRSAAPTGERLFVCKNFPATRNTAQRFGCSGQGWSERSLIGPQVTGANPVIAPLTAQSIAVSPVISGGTLSRTAPGEFTPGDFLVLVSSETTVTQIKANHLQDVQDTDLISYGFQGGLKADEFQYPNYIQAVALADLDVYGEDGHGELDRIVQMQPPSQWGREGLIQQHELDLIPHIHICNDVTLLAQSLCYPGSAHGQRVLPIAIGGLTSVEGVTSVGYEYRVAAPLVGVADIMNHSQEISSGLDSKPEIIVLSAGAERLDDSIQDESNLKEFSIMTVGGDEFDLPLSNMPLGVGAINVEFANARGVLGEFFGDAGYAQDVAVIMHTGEVHFLENKFRKDYSRFDLISPPEDLIAPSLGKFSVNQ